MKTLIKKHYPILIILLILLFSHLETLLNNNGLMIFYGDSYEQMYQLYLGGWERMRQLDFSQWDWSLGYGANYFSQVYYFSTSPFFFITLFFDKAIIPYLFIYLNALKILLLYIFSYKWLNNLHSDKLISVIGSIILSFSGWVIFYYNYNLFLDAFLIYPLILYSIDLFLIKKKGLLVSLSIGVLGIINYYMLYMFAPFFILYTLFRYAIINRKFDIKHFINSAIQMIGFVSLGIGLSAVVLLPSINIVLQTTRIQTISNINLLDTISFTNIYRYISSIFTPVVERFNPNYFISIEYDKGIGWGGGVSLYSFILFPLVISFVIRLKDIFHRNAILLFYSVLLILATFTVTYRLIQGSYDVRWFYMFTLINVYTLSYCLVEIMSVQFSIKQYIISTLLPLFIIICLLIISINKGFYFDSSSLNLLYLIVVISFVFIIIYAFALYFKKRTLLLMVIVIEAIICFILPINIDKPIDSTTFTSFSENLLENSAINYIKENDNGFYRIIYFDGKYGSQNNPSALYFKGTSFYESIYNFEQNDYLDRFRSNWSMPSALGRTNTTILTSVKYYVIESSYDNIPFGFSLFKTVDNFDIYVNDYPISLGYALDDSISEKTFKSLSILNQDRLFLNYIVTPESKNESYTYLNQNTFIKYAENVFDDYYYFENSFNQDISVYIENSFQPNIEIRKLKNYEFYSSFNYSQYHYLSTYIKSEDDINVLEILVTDRAYLNSNYNIYVDYDLSYYNEWYTNITQNTFTNIKIDQDKISADIKITDSKKWVATTVPYDKGWKILINGLETEYSKVNLGFIGFTLEPGDYTIEMTYRAPLFNFGLLISFISIVLFLILFVKKNYKISTK